MSPRPIEKPDELVTAILDSGPFVFPRSLESCVMGVFHGEYALPELPDLPPVTTVLDVGGNVGAFAVWAKTLWPDAHVIGYEPHPKCAELYRRNAPFAELHERAIVAGVSGEKAVASLYEGADWGMNSLYPGITRQSGGKVDVWTMGARDLPRGDCLKIDAEGVEAVTLSLYPYLKTVSVLLFEWHKENDRVACETFAMVAGLRLFRADQPLVSIGRQVWLRSKAVFNHQTRKYELPDAR